MFSVIKFNIYGFVYSFGVIFFIYFVCFHELLQYFTHQQIGYKHKLLDSYDYIVVGSGTGGSTVALRLSEDEHTSVLLIEAGSYGHWLHSIPAIAPLLQRTNVDWSYETVPQKYSCFGLNNNQSRWPMGRIFGGTARLNNMVYVRGHRKDFNLWYLDQYKYDYNVDIFPYFKRSENQMGIYTSSRYHAMDGFMNVDDLPFTSPLADAVIDAANELGYQNQDINGQYYTGFTKPQVNIKNGKRSTIADVIFEKNRPNLHIATGSVAKKILFNKNVARSVEFVRYGTEESVFAKHGIVLSAGVIGTPKLLMLSGIGPKGHLQSLNIKLQKDLPVGLNLQDHITTGLDLIILNTTLPVNLEDFLSFSSVYDYFLRGTGLWTFPGCEVVGIPTEYSFRKRPKLQFMVLPLGMTTDGGVQLRYNVNIRKDVWESYFKPLIGKQVVTILPVLLHPKSRGFVRLNTADPNGQPVIDPKYLSEQIDVDTLIEGIRTISDIIRTEPMQKLGAQIYNKPLPNCREFLFDTRDYWECYVRHITVTSYHPVGTCKMGKEDDTNAVVDYNFKVRGIENLYIADASVMPLLPSGNPNAAIAMIGEKLADILRNWTCRNIKELKSTGSFITGFRESIAC